MRFFVVFLRLQSETCHSCVILKPCLLNIHDRFPALFSSALYHVYKRVRTQLVDLQEVTQATSVQDRGKATQRSCQT
jgi:hypothetical protein